MLEYIDRTMENSFGVQQGWQCPVCKRVYSPTTMMCMYCGNTEPVILHCDLSKDDYEE